MFPVVCPVYREDCYQVQRNDKGKTPGSSRCSDTMLLGSFHGAQNLLLGKVRATSGGKTVADSLPHCEKRGHSQEPAAAVRPPLGERKRVRQSLGSYRLHK